MGVAAASWSRNWSIASSRSADVGVKLIRTLPRPRAARARRARRRRRHAAASVSGMRWRTRPCAARPMLHASSTSTRWTSWARANRSSVSMSTEPDDAVPDVLAEPADLAAAPVALHVDDQLADLTRRQVRLDPPDPVPDGVERVVVRRVPDEVDVLVAQLAAQPAGELAPPGRHHVDRRQIGVVGGEDERRPRRRGGLLDARAALRMERASGVGRQAGRAAVGVGYAPCRLDERDVLGLRERERRGEERLLGTVGVQARRGRLARPRCGDDLDRCRAVALDRSLGARGS